MNWFNLYSFDFLEVNLIRYWKHDLVYEPLHLWIQLQGFEILGLLTSFQIENYSFNSSEFISFLFVNTCGKNLHFLCLFINKENKRCSKSTCGHSNFHNYYHFLDQVKRKLVIGLWAFGACDRLWFVGILFPWRVGSHRTWRQPYWICRNALWVVLHSLLLALLLAYRPDNIVVHSVL